MTKLKRHLKRSFLGAPTTPTWAELYCFRNWVSNIFAVDRRAGRADRFGARSNARAAKQQHPGRHKNNKKTTEI